MSNIQNDFMNPANFMPPPNVGGPSAETKVEAKTGGHLINVQDLVSKSEVLGKMTIHVDPKDPKLPVSPPYVRDSSGIVGGKEDAGGRGNPWLSPIPFVAVTLAMLKLYEVLRQSNLGMAAFENTAMKLTMDLAKTQASLIEHSAKIESQMAMFEAVAGAFAMAGAAVGLGMNAKASFGPEGQAASKANKKFKTAESAENNAKNKLQSKEQDLVQLEKSMKLNMNKNAGAATSPTKTADAPGSEVGPQAGTTPTKTANADHAETASIQKNIDNKKAEVATAKNELEVATANKNEAAKVKGEANHEYNQVLNSMSQYGTMVNTLISSLGQLVNSTSKSFLVIEKGKSDAEQKIVEGYQQLLNRIMDVTRGSQQKTTDVMNSLIQGIEKIDDEHVRASSMSING